MGSGGLPTLSLLSPHSLEGEGLRHHHCRPLLVYTILDVLGLVTCEMGIFAGMSDTEMLCRTVALVWSCSGEERERTQIRGSCQVPDLSWVLLVFHVVCPH